MSTRRALSAAGDIALQLLRLTAASSDVFPPLKNAASGALHMAEMVAKFRTNKALWKELGAYVQSAVAGIVACSAQTGGSQEDIKTRLEGLQAALSASMKIIEEEQAQSRAGRILRFLKEPDMAAEIRKRIDDAVALFELKTISLTEINVQKTFDAVVTNSQSSHGVVSELVSGIAEDTTAILTGTNAIKVDVASILRRNSLLALGVILQKLHYVEGASWNIRHICMSNTRTEIINQILAWVNQIDETDGGRIFLLTAVAGAGKSAIAHTIARHCREHGQLVSSFFFDRTKGRTEPTFLFSTMAMDLSGADERFAASVAAAIENDQSLASAPLSRQFEELLLRPSLQCSIQRPLVMVIDALDEGWDMELLSILKERFTHLPRGFRIFITSRMRPELDVLCRQAHVHWMNMETDTPENMGDMSLFVPHMLNQLAEAQSLGDDWPGEQLRRKFAERAEGLFLWVVIVCQYLEGISYPTKELTKLLSSSDHSAASAEEKMDELYATILNTCNWNDEGFVEDYHRLMGTAMATRTPLTMDALGALFRDKPLASNYTRKKLSPLLTGTREQDNRVVPVRPLHQSLRDFLMTRAGSDVRCKKFCIVEKTHSQELALLCINALNRDLNEEMPGVGYLSKDEDDSPGVPKMQSEGMLEALWYACRFWMEHLVDVDPSACPSMQDSVVEFMEKKVILWIEALASHGRFKELSQARRWAQNQLSTEWHLKFISHKAKLASACFSLSNRLGFEDRREEALESIEESMGMYRELWTDDSDAFGPDLASSLNTLSNRLSSLGRREEALKAVEESVELYRQLWADRPAAFGPDLARSLNTLSNQLSDLGRREEALKAVKESVELYRQLRADRPAGFGPDLARSLNNISADLSSLGRREEALKAAEESVELYRQLWADRPVAFGPDLARSLNSLSIWLSDLGRREEALKAVEESVELYRQLRADRPAAFGPDLALSLNTLSNQLSDLGRREEALKAIEESVELYRQLWADRPAAFGPDLARSLNNFSNRLSSLGRREEALKAVEESVELRRQLWADRPAAFGPDLALSLNTLSIRLSSLGQREEALKAVEESVELYRQLWADRPAAFGPDLAVSLYNLSIHLHTLDRHEAALAAAQESVDIYRPLAKDLPAVFTTNLSNFLHMFVILLESVGRLEEASSVKAERANLDV